jgi:2-succinyl-5-enolpyruvyl-6-hydroxy-3-cyclohexene-1-carboxylate synthase
LPEDGTARPDGRPYVIVEPPHLPAAAEGPGPHPAGRLAIVAGAGTPDPHGLAAFAERAGIPLLADPLSGARTGAAAVAHYDLLLRDRQFAADHRPEFVFRLGDLPTSKPLRAWLASMSDLAQIAFDPNRTWQDPDAVVGMRIHSALPQPETLSAQPGWLDSWRGADASAARAIDAALADELSEPLVARKLGEWLGSEASLFVASSMPIRDIETFLGARDDAPLVLANRGANGIDGTVSTAFGAVAGGERPLLLLTGDVAVVHDIGGLLAGRRLGLSLTIVVLNNDGGGIFHFLPVAGQADAFEEHVATPHGLEFERAAALFGCAYERPGDVDALRSTVTRAMREPGVTLIEVHTDRTANLELHRRIADSVIKAIQR